MGDSTTNSYLTQLKVLAEQNEINYNEMASQNNNNYNETNTNAIEELVKTINQNLSELNLLQNQSNTINNLDQEALVKKEQLLRMENDDLLSQLRQLEIIQSTITNKDRLIQQTNNNVEKENKNIKVLIISIILGIILLIAIVLLNLNKINKNIFILILIAILIFYFLLYIYSYNIFYFQTSIKMLFDRKSLRLGYELNNWSESIKANINSIKDSSQQSWIDENCLCPAKEPAEEEYYVEVDENNVYAKGIPGYQSGYYYYDNSSPAQLLLPEPTKDMDLTQNIEWVDYSPDGNSKYYPSSNQTTTLNNNYYNYNSSNDPVNIQLRKLDEAKVLVNDKTYTGNM